MSNIYIFINTLSLIIFGLSLFVSFILYRKVSNVIERLEKTSNFAFLVSILIGASYFLYNLSHEMTLDNIGNYLTVLMLSIIYPSLCLLILKAFKELCVKTT